MSDTEKFVDCPVVFWVQEIVLQNINLDQNDTLLIHQTARSLREFALKIATKALWLVESRLGQSVSLETIASTLRVSPFHLSRAFVTVYGISLMRYVRRRRLAVAAQRLTDTHLGVLDIAIEAGYGSQEAFTRAFQVEFQVPPRAFRDQQHRQGGQATVYGLEAMSMQTHSKFKLKPPRQTHLDATRLIGLAHHYTAQTSGQIPDQWAKFNELSMVGAIFEQQFTYGVCYNADTEGNLDYLCAVAVDSFDGAPDDLDRLTLPAQTYAVFRHDGHISEIRDVWKTIWNQGLVESELSVSEGPAFEKYGPEFDPDTGSGGFEIWLPIRAS